MRRAAYGKLRPNQKKLARRSRAPAPQSECRRTKDEDQAGGTGRDKSAPQKQMRSRPATSTASFVDSCFCLVTAGRQNDRFSPATLPLSRTKRRLGLSELPIRHLAMTKMQPLRRPAALSSLFARCSLLRKAKSNEPRAESGEEAATPGQPVALARVFWMIPRQFTLENRRLPLALPQSSGKHRNSHVSLNPLSATSLRPATEKTSPLVQKLWTMCLPCGSPRKTKN